MTVILAMVFSTAPALLGFWALFHFQQMLLVPASDVIETLRFSGASSNANCALRTLRRMLHKAEEWTLIRHAPKLKLMKEYGRSLRLDDEAEKKLLAGAASCNWRKRSLQLFRDIIILMRDTGMRNERELYRMRIENLDWETRVI
jgi:hypothetical protein